VQLTGGFEEAEIDIAAALRSLAEVGLSLAQVSP
jgi:hypothetical protein